MRYYALALLATMAACDDSSEPRGDGGLDASTSDSATPDGGAPDAPTPDAALLDSATDSTTDAPSADALADASTGCGSGDTTGGWNLPRTCLDDASCLDHATCVELDKESAGYGEYEACGELVITPSSSDEACFEEPPFGPWPDSPPRRCGSVQYAGNVRFFCKPDGSAVAARFVATLMDPTGFSEYWGHEFQAGSGGGSGDSRSYSAYVDDGSSVRFFGWQHVDLDPPGSTVSLQVWFMSGSIVDPGDYAYTGGFSTSVPPE